MKAFLGTHRWAIVMDVYVILHVIAALLMSPLAVAAFAIVEACLFSWLFVIGYASVRGWWRSSGGRQLMSLGVFVVLLTTASLLPDSFGLGIGARDWTVFAILLGMSAMMLNLAKMLVKAQWRRWPHRGLKFRDDFEDDE